MQRNKSLINGAGFEPPVVVGAPVPRDVTGDAMREGVARSAANMGGLFREMVRTEDFTKQLEQEKTLMQARNQADIESTRRLMLPDGDEEAFFDDRGNFKEVAVKDFVAPYRKILGGMGSGIQDPERAMKMKLRADSTGDEMFGLLMKNGLKVSRQKRDDTFKDCFDLALAQKDYDRANGLIGDGVNNGLFSPERGAVMSFEVGKKGAVDSCDSLLIKNPTGLFDKLEDGSLDKHLSPMEQEVYRRKLRSMADDDGRDGFIKSFTLVPKSVSDEGSSKKKKEDGIKYTGLGTEEEYGWVDAINSGRGSEVMPQITAKAILEARAFKPSDPNSPDMEIARDKFIRKYSVFGLEKESLTRQWGIAEAANKKLVTPTVDVGNIVEDIGKQGLLVDDEAMAKFRNSIRDDDGKEWGKGGVMREKYMTTADIKNTDNDRAAKEKYIVSETKRMSSDIQARVGKSFLAWRDSTEEGQKASAVEQYEKIHSLVREETKKKDLILVNKGGEIDSSVSAARQAQNNKYEELAKSRGKEVFIDTRDKSEQLQEISLGYDTSKKDLPEGILLPKAAMEGFDKENGVVEVTFDNKRFRRFRVVGECEGDTPIMTYEVARRGAYNPKSSYKVNMRIRGGNTKAAMEEQDEASKGMNIIKEGNINSPQAPQFKSAEMIIGNEARRDKKGNLSVYKLPAGDGGGTHEIAGINNSSHPKEFAKLKGMINSGDHQGAEQEAQRYIMKYTQPVGNTLDSAGVKSAGISYFLRDMHFNSGEYGVARVICRAMGIPDSKKLNNNTSEAMKNYLKTHTEDELLDALKGSRENLYKSIASNNSEKQQFLRGWINRNNKAYKQAKGMA